MNEMTLDQNEEVDLLVHEVSDEALERVAHKRNEQGDFTLWYCTALTVCPGP